MTRSLLYVLLLQSLLTLSAVAQVNLGMVGEEPDCSGLTTVEQCLELHRIPLTKDALISALHNEDFWIWSLAASEVGNKGLKDAVPDLIGLLASRSVPVERIILAQALARLGDARGVEILRSYCDDATVSISDRLTAASTLLDFQPKSCPETLIAGLQSDVWQFREEAIGMIPRFKELSPSESAQVRAALLRSLSDQEGNVRLQAANTMWGLGDRSFIPVLQAALAKETEPMVRHGMEYSLKRLQGTSSE
ncbi:MAG: HEAT repeat domain-containing protein [Terriglobales bacterium]